MCVLSKRDTSQLVSVTRGADGKLNVVVSADVVDERFGIDAFVESDFVYDTLQESRAFNARLYHDQLNKTNALREKFNLRSNSAVVALCVNKTYRDMTREQSQAETRVEVDGEVVSQFDLAAQSLSESLSSDDNINKHPYSISLSDDNLEHLHELTSHLNTESTDAMVRACIETCYSLFTNGASLPEDDANSPSHAVGLTDDVLNARLIHANERVLASDDMASILSDAISGASAEQQLMIAERVNAFLSVLSISQTSSTHDTAIYDGPISESIETEPSFKFGVEPDSRSQLRDVTNEELLGSTDDAYEQELADRFLKHAREIRQIPNQKIARAFGESDFLPSSGRDWVAARAQYDFSEQLGGRDPMYERARFFLSLIDDDAEYVQKHAVEYDPRERWLLNDDGEYDASLPFADTNEFGDLYTPDGKRMLYTKYEFYPETLEFKYELDSDGLISACFDERGNRLDSLTSDAIEANESLLQERDESHTEDASGKAHRVAVLASRFYDVNPLEIRPADLSRLIDEVSDIFALSESSPEYDVRLRRLDDWARDVGYDKRDTALSGQEVERRFLRGNAGVDDGSLQSDDDALRLGLGSNDDFMSIDDLESEHDSVSKNDKKSTFDYESFNENESKDDSESNNDQQSTFDFDEKDSSADGTFFGFGGDSFGGGSKLSEYGYVEDE